MDKILIIKISVFVLLFLQYLMYRFLIKKQEIALKKRMSISCIGFVIGVIGVAVAAYFGEVEVGARIAVFGIILVFVGIIATLRYKREQD